MLASMEGSSDSLNRFLDALKSSFIGPYLSKLLRRYDSMFRTEEVGLIANYRFCPYYSLHSQEMGH